MGHTSTPAIARAWGPPGTLMALVLIATAGSLAGCANDTDLAANAKSSTSTTASSETTTTHPDYEGLDCPNDTITGAGYTFAPDDPATRGAAGPAEEEQAAREFARREFPRESKQPSRTARGVSTLRDASGARVAVIFTDPDHAGRVTGYRACESWDRKAKGAA